MNLLISIYTLYMLPFNVLVGFFGIIVKGKLFEDNTANDIRETLLQFEPEIFMLNTIFYVLIYNF